MFARMVFAHVLGFADGQETGDSSDIHSFPCLDPVADIIGNKDHTVVANRGTAANCRFQDGGVYECGNIRLCPKSRIESAYIAALGFWSTLCHLNLSRGLKCGLTPGRQEGQNCWGLRLP
jgi:hypothetical protein